jgi:hypothetical protein
VLVERRDDHEHRDRGPCGACERHEAACAPPPLRHGKPDADPSHDEAHLLLRERREHEPERARSEPAVVERVDRRKQHRTGQSDRMELVQRQPLRGGIQEIREREPERRPFGAEPAQREPPHRHRPERDGGRLRHDQEIRARPQPPERSPEHEHGVDVRREP